MQWKNRVNEGHTPEILYCGFPAYFFAVLWELQILEKLSTQARKRRSSERKRLYTKSNLRKVYKTMKSRTNIEANYNPVKDDLLFIRNELSKIKARKYNIPKQTKQEERIFSNNEPGMFSSHLCQRGFSKCHGITSCIFYIYIAG